MGKAKRFLGGTNLARNDRFNKALDRQSNMLRSQNITPATQLNGVPNNEFIKSTGGIHAGPDGYIADALTIATGILDLTANATGDIVKIRKYININPESGTTDTLDLITSNGTEFPQMEIVLVGQSGDTITLTHDSGSAAGNNRAILCPGAVSYTLDGTDAVFLFYDSALSKWRVEGDANAGGGGGASFPLTYAVDDQGTKGGETVTHDLNQPEGHKLQFIADGDVDITIDNIPTSNGRAVDFYIEVTQNNVGGHAITVNDSEWVGTPTFTTTADETTLIAVHADGDGNLRSINLLNSSTTLGDAGASKQLDNLSAPVLNTDIDVNTKILTNIAENTFVQHLGTTAASYSIAVAAATDKLVFNVPLNSEWVFTENNIAKWEMSDTRLSGANVVLTNSLTINDSTADPSVNGQFTRNGNDVKVMSNSIVRNLSDIASVLTTKGDLFGFDTANAQISVGTNGETLVADSTDPLGVAWGNVNTISQLNSNVTVTDAGSGLIVNTVDGGTVFSMQATRLDVENLPVFGVSALSFYDTTDAASATTLTQNQTDFTVDMPVNSDTYKFNFNTTVGLSIDLLRTRLYSNTPNTASAALSLYRDDPSAVDNDPIGDINFDGNTESDGGIFTYADIVGYIADATAATEDGRVRIRTAIAGGSVPSNALTVEGPTTTIHQDSSVAGDMATLKLLKTDATPLANEDIGEILFRIDDDGTETSYAGVSAQTSDVTNAGTLQLNARADNGLLTAVSLVGDDNNQRFMMLGGGTSQFRIQPGFDRMGYFVKPQVTDFTLVLGTGGSLQIPQFSDGSPSITDLNQAFGAFDGAMGQDTNDGKLYIRKSSTVWSYYSESGTVT